MGQARIVVDVAFLFPRPSRAEVEECLLLTFVIDKPDVFSIQE